MRRSDDEVIAAQIYLGLVTLIVFFVACCLVAGGVQFLFGPIRDHGETRDPAAWDRVLGIVLIATGLGSGGLAFGLVRGANP